MRLGAKIENPDIADTVSIPYRFNETDTVFRVALPGVPGFNSL